MKKIIIPSNKLLGISIKAEAFKRDGFFFDFPDFPEGYEYPIVKKIDKTLPAYKEGVRVGDRIISLNGFSFFKKDISTILSDFEYEKRSNSFLTLMID